MVGLTLRKVATATTAISLLVPGAASANDELVRGLLGLGAAIIINGAQQQQQQPRRYGNPGLETRASEERKLREARAEVQRRLNVLGFDAGTPDGVYGPQTRNAIARFQASIGNQANGVISKDEIAVLYETSDAVENGTASPPGFAAGAGSSSFPSLAGSGSAAANGSSFPQLPGAPAVPGAGSAFPSISSTPGRSGTGASAFPVIGSGPTPGAAPAGFPALGSGAASGSPATAFPAIGSAAAPGSAPGAFPSLNNTKTPEQAKMPGVAQPAATAASTSFPQLGEAKSSAAAAMPAIAAPGAEDSQSPQTVSLQTELEHLQFEDQPAILGVSLGHAIEEVNALFKEGGFPDCNSAPTGLVCARSTPSMKDTIQVWRTLTGAVYGMIRTVEFLQPAPSAQVKAQFVSSYPQLMRTDGYGLSSRSLCNVHSLSALTAEQVLTQSHGVEENKVPEIRKDLEDLAASCPLTYKISFQETAGQVTKAEIVFMDLTPVVRQATVNAMNAEIARKQAEEEKNKAQPIASELKL